MAPTRFLVISDTHDQWPYTSERSPPKDVDVLMHCGDLTQVGGLPSFKRAIESIKSIDAELKLVIAGNHDLELDRKWVQDNAEDVDDDLEDSRQCVEFLHSLKDSGIHYLEEGTHTFTLSDGRNFSVYASPYTPEFNGYAFAYGSEDRFNGGCCPMPDGVDIAMTHGPALLTDRSYRLDINAKGEHLGCEKLAQALERVKPKMHCFGHIHEGRGAARAIWRDGENALPRIETPEDEQPLRVQNNAANRERETLLVNAAINEGEGMGWLVEVDLGD